MAFLTEYWSVGIGLIVAVLVSWRRSQKTMALDLKHGPIRVPSQKQSIRLINALPEFAAELETLLAMEGRTEVAAQIQHLQILDRCRCQDDFCSTFCVLPKPEGSYGPNHHTIVLSPQDGTINVDVVEGRIACIEVLYRNDVQAKLISALV